MLLFTVYKKVACSRLLLSKQCSTNLQLALVQVDDVRVAVREQTLCTPLTADTTLLVAGEDAVIAVSILFVKMVRKMTYA
jgi:hypothetical protein